VLFGDPHSCGVVLADGFHLASLTGCPVWIERLVDPLLAGDWGPAVVLAKLEAHAHIVAVLAITVVVGYRRRTRMPHRRGTTATRPSHHPEGLRRLGVLEQATGGGQPAPRSRVHVGPLPQLPVVSYEGAA